MLSGRPFQDGMVKRAARLQSVNQAFAKTYFPEANPSAITLHLRIRSLSAERSSA